jgi:hypothetical protein
VCPIYNLVAEITSHILWSCSSSKEVWAECDMKIHKCYGEEDDFLCIIAKLMEKLDKEDMEFVVMVARKI